LTDEPVSVGRVGRPHGLDGSFVVERPSENEQLFAPGATLLIDGEPVTVAARKRSGGRLVVKLDGPASRGAPITVPRDRLPTPEPDHYYVFQLVGLEVVEDGGRVLGQVADVLPGVANDVLELQNGALLPMHEECVLNVDLATRRILVSRGFSAPQ
jgi:16S rRNA processing protein RimM